MSPGRCLRSGTTPVTCNATDAHANSSQKTFTVNVVDTTPPAIAVPAPIVAEATGPAGAAVAFNVSASDLVDGPVAVSCDHESGSVFALGTTPVTCNATDARGNRGQKTLTVKVVDQTSPTISVPAPIVTQAATSGGAVVAYGVTAVDLVDGPVAVTCHPASGSLFHGSHDGDVHRDRLERQRSGSEDLQDHRDAPAASPTAPVRLRLRRFPTRPCSHRRSRSRHRSPGSPRLPGIGA